MSLEIESIDRFLEGVYEMKTLASPYQPNKLSGAFLGSFTNEVIGLGNAK